MKFIFVGSTDYLDISYNNEGQFDKITDKIVEIVSKNQEYELVIFIENTRLKNTNTDELESEKEQNNDLLSYLEIIKKIPIRQIKYLMFGKNFLDINSNLQILMSPLESKENFKFFKMIDTIKINENTLMIFIDSILMNIKKHLGKNPEKILISETNYKSIFDNLKELSDSEEETKEKTIKQLIIHQFEEIKKILEENKNIKNLYFVTQEPVFSVYLSKNKIDNEFSIDIISDQKKTDNQIEYNGFFGYKNINVNEVLISWLSEYFYIFRTYKVIFLTGSNGLYQKGKINILVKPKIETEENYLSVMNFEQYILGSSNYSETTEPEMNPPIGSYEVEFEFKSELTGTIKKINVKYDLKSNSNSVGFLNFINKNFELFKFENINNFGNDNNNNNLSKKLILPNKELSQVEQEKQKEELSQVKSQVEQESEPERIKIVESQKEIKEELPQEQKEIKEELPQVEQELPFREITQDEINNNLRNIKSKFKINNIIIESDNEEKKLNIIEKKLNIIEKKEIDNEEKKISENIIEKKDSEKDSDEYLKKYIKYKNKLIKYRKLSKEPENIESKENTDSSNDPYKIRYMKYKKKLVDLRKSNN